MLYGFQVLFLVRILFNTYNFSEVFFIVFNFTDTAIEPQRGSATCPVTQLVTIFRKI